MLTDDTHGGEMAQKETLTGISDWMQSVATVLSRFRRESPPYTLGEAVDELGAYVDSVKAHHWPHARPVRDNLQSLHRELDAQRSILGPLVGTHVNELFAALRHGDDRESIVRAAVAFGAAWASDAAKMDAFEDLCNAAKELETTTVRLEQLAAIIASQLGVDATDRFGPLRDAAEALGSSEERYRAWHGVSFQSPLDQAERLRLARESLKTVVSGRVVVWAAYDRATVSGMRTSIGPITLLRPEIALVHAFDDGVQDFPERSELEEIREHVRWLDDLHRRSLAADSHYALVRIDLGERSNAGAIEDARRLLHAILSIPVTAGGVSWRETGDVAVLHDGRVRLEGKGFSDNGRRLLDDTYGIGVTAEILDEVAEPLGSALSRRQMPEHLIEALHALRESGMTNHRDVSLYGGRPVTLRFATALEDHAIELIASVMDVGVRDLVSSLEAHYALTHATSQALRQLMAPFDESWAMEGAEIRRELEDSVSRDDRAGNRIVDIVKVVESKNAIRSLRMTALQRADFEDALRIVTDTKREHTLLTGAREATELLRSRHRRVRNAINHGLPLAPTTLASVRKYATFTAAAALNLAMEWFVGDDSGAALVAQQQTSWSDRLAQVADGESWIKRV